MTRGRVSDAPPSLTPTPAEQVTGPVVTGPGVGAAAVTGPGVGGPAMTSVGMPTMGMPIQVPAGHDVLTIGVAIEVPEPFSSELRKWRADFGDQRARSIPTHLTLLPPTLVPRESFDEVAEHLGDLAHDTRSFRLRLCGTGTFRPISPVVFVCVREGAVGCDGLQRRLRTGPLERELAFPFHPHVTLAQDVDAGSLDRALRTLSDYTAEFTVDSLGLYEHGPDTGWRHRQRFGFNGTG